MPIRSKKPYATKSIPAGTIKRIHVDKHVIAANRKAGRDDPAVTIQTSKGPIKTRLAIWDGPSSMEQGLKPLGCGARLWIYTKAQVKYE